MEYNLKEHSTTSCAGAIVYVDTPPGFSRGECQIPMPKGRGFTPHFDNIANPQCGNANFSKNLAKMY